MDKNQSQLITLAEYYFRTNNHKLSESILEQIIIDLPNNSKANELLAYIHGNQGKIDSSFKLLNLACQQNDCSPEALYYLGTAQLNRNLHDLAITSFKKSILKAGNFFEALHDLGSAYAQLGKTQESLSCYQDCLKFNRNLHEVHFNIGGCLDDLKQHNEALIHYEKAIQQNPDFAEAWYNKGLCLHKLMRYEEALAHYDRVIQLKPDFAEAWSNKGMTLHDLKRYEEALNHYDQAIQLAPDHCVTYWNKSLTKLVMGDLNEGWDLYGYRPKEKDLDLYHHNQIEELKSLDDIANKNIFVWCEQGLGDTIQFCRYIPKLINLGAKVYLQVQKPLLNLLGSQLDCAVISEIDNSLKFDFQVPLLTLPKLFKTNLQNIPEPLNIKVDSRQISKWKEKLNISNEKPNIGIAISGNPNHKNDLNRSIPLELLSSLFDLGKFFLIQKEVNAADEKIAVQHKNIIFLGDQLEDFIDTASIISNMDLIISVDTSLIHLAGSLNKKSLLMLPWCPEWRWLLDRLDSPWYPSIKIFRQKFFEDWESVINQIKNELEKYNMRSSEQYD